MLSWDVGSESYRPSKYNKHPENYRKRLTDPTPTCWAQLVLWPVSPPLNSPDPGPSQPRIVSMGSGCWSEPSWLSCSVRPCRPACPQTALVSEKCCSRTPSPVTFITKLGKRISYVYLPVYNCISDMGPCRGISLPGHDISPSPISLLLMAYSRSRLPLCHLMTATSLLCDQSCRNHPIFGILHLIENQLRSPNSRRGHDSLIP